MFVFQDRRGIPGGAGMLNVLAYPNARVARLITLDDWDGPDVSIAIITDLQIAVGGNQQIVHTLGPGVFIYDFGDRAGAARIAGMAFPELCDEEKDLAFHPSMIGIERVYDYYQRNRLTSRLAPIKMVLGHSTVFLLLLHDFQFSTISQSDVCRFELTATIVPPEIVEGELEPEVPSETEISSELG